MSGNELEDFARPLTWFDHVVIVAGQFAPAIGAAAVLLVLVSVSLLAFRTREGGRIEIFAGTVLAAIAFAYYNSFSFGRLGTGLVYVSVERLAVAIPALLFAIGLARLSFSAIKRRKNAA